MKKKVYIMFAGGDSHNIVKSTAESIEYSDHIISCGFVSKEDLPSYYSASDGYLFLGLSEGFGLGISSIEALQSELAAWNEDYNSDPSPINWQFTTEDSRIKLARLYPDVEKSIRDREERKKAKTKSTQELPK